MGPQRRCRLLLVLISVFVIFAGLYDQVDAVNCFDREVLEAVRFTLKNPVFDATMPQITKLGGEGSAAVIAGYYLAGEHETAELLLAAVLKSGLICQTVKHLTGRRRPDGGYLSFPSGHTTTAFSMATVLADRYRKWKIPLFLIAGMVGYSRMYLNRHWPTDVLAGAALGYLIGRDALKNQRLIFRNGILAYVFRF